MIEVLLIIFVVQRVRKIAAEKGLPLYWAALALLIPVMGIGVGFFAVVVVAVLGLAPQEYATFIALPFYLAAEVATALVIVNYMKKRPAGVLPAPVAPSAPISVAEPGESLAGYCSECEANKWLTNEGACPEGHPSSCVSNVYSAPRTSA